MSVLLDERLALLLLVHAPSTPPDFWAVSESLRIKTLLQKYFTKKGRETNSYMLLVTESELREDDSMCLKAIPCLSLNIKDLFL